VSIRLSLYQKWLPNGREQWRALPATEQTGAKWLELHAPGSIPADELSRMPELPDPPPFPESAPRRKQHLAAPVLVRLTIDQVACLKELAGEGGISFSEALRQALG
jgi:hypothetical protein